MMMSLPWNDRRGAFSPLRTLVLLLALAPGLWLTFQLATGALGAKPIEAATHETGRWAIRFLLLSLAITPLRRITGWSRLIIIRRMLGLTALGYALAHLGLYVADQAWDIPKVAAEIFARTYLLIGFAAVLGLVILGVTSFDAMIRRMGRNWHRLHMLSYGLAVLGILHFFMQSKGVADEAGLMMGLFLLLMLYRLAHSIGLPLHAPLLLVALAALAGLGTAGLEMVWYWIGKEWPLDRAMRILEANLTHIPTIRPAWWVLATGLVLAMASLPRLVRTRRSVAAGS